MCRRAPHCLRFAVRDRPGIVAALATILAHYQISIDALLQKPGFPHSALSFVMTLEACDSAVLRLALDEIARLDFHVEPPCASPFFSIERAGPAPLVDLGPDTHIVV